jgi:hypothetical protein
VQLVTEIVVTLHVGNLNHLARNAASATFTTLAKITEVRNWRHLSLGYILINSQVVLNKSTRLEHIKCEFVGALNMPSSG